MSYTFKRYSRAVTRHAGYPRRGRNLVYPALGLCGEAGELAEKIKKLWRNFGVTSAAGVDKIKNPTKRKAAKKMLREIAKEGGDVLWYLNAIFQIEMPRAYSLGTVAKWNVIKLNDRRKRGVIKSEGDNR